MGELFGSLPKLPHPIFFAQGKKYVGSLSLRAYQKQRHGQSRVILMLIIFRELRHSASKLRRVESNFGGLAAVGALLRFFAEIAAPNIFCVWQKALGFDVPRDQKIDDTVFRAILMRIIFRELRHSANKLRRVESNFGDLAALGELLRFFCRNCRTQCFLRVAKSIRVRCP